MSYKKLLIGLAVVAMVLGLTVTVSAQTTDVAALMAQIAALQSQISGLTGGTPALTASTNFSRDLTVGSTGSDVRDLQLWLNSNAGASLPGTTYFGALTKAALMKYQASVGLPATGYFGPLTRAHLAQLMPVTPVTGLPAGCTSTAGFSTTTGASCSTTTTLPAGCVAGALFSATTGASCTGTTGPVTLTGGAGAVNSYTLSSTPSNPKIGEDQADVPVIGLKVEADSSSDLAVSAVKVTFVQGTATSDFDKFAKDVSVWVGGKEYARANASTFTEDNDWARTLTLNSGAVIKAGATGEIVVKVSGISNLDSDDAGKTWTADITSVRTVDAQGSLISEDPTTGTRTMTFQSFATATGAALQIIANDATVNDAHPITVDATKSTDNVPLLSFKLKAKGDSDLLVKKLGIGVTVTGETGIQNIVSGGTSPALHLVINGQDYGDVSYGTSDIDTTGATTSSAVLFDKVNYTIPAGETVNAQITADLLSVADTAALAGDTITVTLGETQTDVVTLTRVQDQSGTNLVDADITGSVTGGADVLNTSGPSVTLVSASWGTPSVGSSANDDQITGHIVFRVTAVGSPLYLADTAAATTTAVGTGAVTNGVIYKFTVGGTATTSGLSAAALSVTNKDSGVVAGDNGDYLIPQDASATFDLAVTRTDSAAYTGGQIQMLLKGIGWNTDSSTTFSNMYTSNLDDFKTDLTNLN